MKLLVAAVLIFFAQLLSAQSVRYVIDPVAQDSFFLLEITTEPLQKGEVRPKETIVPLLLRGAGEIYTLIEKLAAQSDKLRYEATRVDQMRDKIQQCADNQRAFLKQE